jgi:hypothetical protein
MKQRHTILVFAAAALAVLALLAAGCGGTSRSGSAEPAVVERVPGSDAYKITLTAETAKRLEVRTAVVTQDGSETAMPYEAVFYSPTGAASAYVNSGPLTFERQAVVVDRIVGDRALLSEGPSAGTRVATVGVSELWGIESGAGATR